MEVVDFSGQLTTVATLHNHGQYEELKTHFAKDASVQLPATPRSAKIDAYVQAVAKDPYAISFGATEIVYSLPGRAATRTPVTITAPGRFNLRENATIDWVLDDGYWRIMRIAVSDWSSIVGKWRRPGRPGEGSIDLRMQPGGTYVVYVNDDTSLPAFRGSYTTQADQVTFVEGSAYDGKLFNTTPGVYAYKITPTGMSLRKIDDEHSWRGERFAGEWMMGR